MQELPKVGDRGWASGGRYDSTVLHGTVTALSDECILVQWGPTHSSLLTHEEFRSSIRWLPDTRPAKRRWWQRKPKGDAFTAPLL